VKLHYWIDVCIFLGFAVFVVSQEPLSPRYLTGIGIAVAGFALSMLARAQLGRSLASERGPEHLWRQASTRNFAIPSISSVE
jgi:hypothetical protein